MFRVHLKLVCYSAHVLRWIFWNRSSFKCFTSLCFFFSHKINKWIELFFFYSIENNLHNFLQSTNDLFCSFVEFHDKCVDFEWSLFVAAAAVAAACRAEWIAVALFLWWKLRHVKLELKTTSELNTKLD